LTLETAQLCAFALWSAPILVLQVVHARRERPLWAVALDVPLAVALDFVTLFVAARFVRLEVAIIGSRLAWVAVGGGVLGWRWKSGGVLPAWPKELHPHALLAAIIAGTLGFLACSAISHKSMIWDLEWHNSSVATLAAQKIPFVNGLWPKEVLHYHFSGDALATALRTLSFDAMAAPNALHAGHDLMFALIAFTVTLLTLGLGASSAWSAILSGLAVILQGPIGLRLSGDPNEGFTYHSFIHISYRPHVPLAGLMLVGAIGAVAVRASRPWIEPRATVPFLVLTMALLAVTDETSTAVIGLALGAAWIIDPRLIADSRRGGLVVLVGIGVVFAGMNLLTWGSLAPGGPVSAMTWSSGARLAEIHWRSMLPLSTEEGKVVLFLDALPVVACGLALIIGAASARSRPRAALAAFALTTIAVALILVPHLEINHDGTEVSRFWVAPFFAAVVLGVIQLPRVQRGSIASFLFFLGIGVPAMNTAKWLGLEGSAMVRDTPLAARLNHLDCRATVGAHWGDRAEPAYVEPAEWWTVSGCRPVYNWGDAFSATWPLRMNMVTAPMTQLQRLDENLEDRNAVVYAFCRVDAPTTDPICSYALRRRGGCSREGESFARCPLAAADRAALLATH